MKFNRIILVALIASLQLQGIAPHIPASSSKATFFQRQYKQVKNDLKIVQKCYLSNAKCTPQERIQARNAVLRLTAETAALIAALGGLSYLAYKNLYRNKADDKTSNDQNLDIEDKQDKSEPKKNEAESKQDDKKDKSLSQEQPANTANSAEKDEAEKLRAQEAQRLKDEEFIKAELAKNELKPTAGLINNILKNADTLSVKELLELWKTTSQETGKGAKIKMAVAQIALDIKRKREQQKPVPEEVQGLADMHGQQQDAYMNILKTGVSALNEQKTGLEAIKKKLAADELDEQFVKGEIAQRTAGGEFMYKGKNELWADRIINNANKYSSDELMDKKNKLESNLEKLSQKKELTFSERLFGPRIDPKDVLRDYAKDELRIGIAELEIALALKAHKQKQ